jgi:hypothetical protein
LEAQVYCGCGSPKLAEATDGESARVCNDCGRPFQPELAALAGEELAESIAEKPTSPPPTESALVAADLAEDHADDTPLVTHAGLPVSEDDVFFVQPPPQIGRLLSAHTSLNLANPPTPLRKKLTISLLVYAFLIAVASSLVLAFPSPYRSISSQLLGGWACVSVVSFFLFSFPLLFWGRKLECTFVGTHGVASAERKGSSQIVQSKKWLEFRQAAYLLGGQQTNYWNGVYVGTMYHYAWVDSKGEILFVIEGTFKAKDGQPEPGNPIYFALAAEDAWTRHLHLRIAQRKQETGKDDLRFRLGKSGELRLTRTGVVIRRDGIEHELRRGEIGRITVGTDNLTFEEVGAKQGWFRKEGFHSFPFSMLANGRFFLEVVEEYLGVPVDEAT